MRKRNTLQISLAPALAFILWPAPASFAEDEDKKGWVSSAEVSLVATGGNSESTTFALKYDLSRGWTKSRFKLQFAGLRAESDTGRRIALGPDPGDFEIIDERRSELTAENYSVSGRYERDASEKLFWYFGGGWERNEFAGFENRYSVEAGGGHTWRKSDDGHFITSYALTGTRQEDLAVVDAETFLGIRLQFDFARKLTETATYAALLVIDENLDETSDLRANLDQSLAVSISDRLALKASIQFLFDNAPALEALPLIDPDGFPSGESVLVELDELDSIFKTTLVIQF